MGMFFASSQLEGVSLDSIIQVLMEYSAILSVIITANDGLVYCADNESVANENTAAGCVDFLDKVNDTFRDKPQSVFCAFNEKDLYISRVCSLIFIVEIKPNTVEMVKLRLKNVLEKNMDIIKHFDLV